MPRLVQKRKQIDPKTIRKHSSIVQDRADPILIVGTRDRTDYGFVVRGSSCKTFETLHMVVAANSTTPVWSHPKKTRCFRVVSGTGHYQVNIPEEDTTRTEVRPVSPGDEILVVPGTVHRLTAATKLELYVTQDARYEANLEELSPVERLAEIDNAELQGISADEKILRIGRPMRRNRTKAADQIAAMRGEAPRAQRADGGNPENFFRNDVADVNAMPVLNFSEDGAG